MKKISRRDYDSLNPEQKEIVKKLGIQIDENSTSSFRSHRCNDSVLENYACVVETTCKLCQTVSISVFAMTGTGGLLTSSQSSLDAIEGMKVKTRAETVNVCSNCHDILKLMSTEDLIALTIRVAKGDIRCKKRE